jgi:hypothetical protein
MMSAATPSGPRPDGAGSIALMLDAGDGSDEGPASRLEVFIGSRRLEYGLGAMPSKPRQSNAWFAALIHSCASPMRPPTRSPEGAQGDSPPKLV